MRGDGEPGHPASIRIEQAVDQVQVGRPTAPCYNGELTPDRSFC
jgi:hypothetical protein